MDADRQARARKRWPCSGDRCSAGVGVALSLIHSSLPIQVCSHSPTSVPKNHNSIEPQGHDHFQVLLEAGQGVLQATGPAWEVADGASDPSAGIFSFEAPLLLPVTTL